MAKNEKQQLDFSEELASAFHYPVVDESRYERRTACSRDLDGTLYGLVSYEEARVRRMQFVSDEKSAVVDIPLGMRPSLYCGDEGISAVWIEKTAKGWQVVAGGMAGKREVVFENSGLCVDTVALQVNGVLFAAWAAFDDADGVMRIRLSRREGAEWQTPLTLSGGMKNAFRPCLAAGKELCVAWDENGSSGQQVRVSVVDFALETIAPSICFSRKDERLYRAVAASRENGFAIACIAVRDVVDSQLGIVDHSTGIAFAVIENKCLTEQKEWVANLDEGLLGIENYTPYFGIRRKCNLTALADGALWLTWEMRFERAKRIPEKETPVSDEHYGWLAGRCYRNGRWEEKKLLHEGGTCYSLAGGGETLGAAWLMQENVFLLPELQVAEIDAENALPLVVDRRGAERWDATLIPVEKTEPYREAGGRSLFWADTHNHSNFSPDAEGEPDEMLGFARDMAGLDIMAMVENGYYPHAGLLPGEWEIEQALAALYTKDGRFVVLPGYEFSSHEKDLTPNFNHRYVLFERGGPYYDRLNAETRNVDSLAKKIESAGGIMVAHHPVFGLSPSPCDRFLEVVSSWRVSMEEKDFVKKRLASGERFTFIGSSDGHRMCPGLGGALTGVYADALTPEAVMVAYRKRRTIATQGLRIAIDFRVNDLFIGEEGTAHGSPHLRLNVTSPEPLEFVEILRDNETIYRREDCGVALSDAFEDGTASAGSHFYYVRVKARGDEAFNEPTSLKGEYSGPFTREGRYSFNFAKAFGPFAWTTPIWVDLGKPDNGRKTR